MRRYFWLLAIFLVPGCTYKTIYHRAGLVPVVQPPPYSGAPLPARHELTFGSSVVIRQQPREGEENIEVISKDGTQILSYTKGNADWVPRAQMNLAWRVRLGTRWTLGLMAEYGSDRWMVKTYTDTIDLRPKGPTWGAGLHLFRAFGIQRGFDLGIGMEFFIYSIPFERALMREVDENVYELVSIESDRAYIALGSLSFLPTWRIGKAHVYAGFTFRNQPTVPKETEQVHNPLADLILLLVFPPALLMQSDDVEVGPVYSIVSAGFEVPIGERTRFYASLYYPMNSSPIEYSPLAMIGLKWDSGGANTEAVQEGSWASSLVPSILSGFAAY